MQKQKVLIIRKGDVNPDPRIERIIYALYDRFDLEVFAFDNTANAPPETYIENVRINRFRGIHSKDGQKPSKWLERVNFILFFVLLQFKVLFSNYKAIHACDFDAYFPIVIAAKIKGVRIIYDVFDFYYDIIKNLPLPIRTFIKKVDLKMMSLADYILIADDSRYVQIPDKFHDKVSVIYNTPPDLYYKFKDEISKDVNTRIKIIYLGLINFHKRDLRFFIDEVLKNEDQLELEIYGKGKHFKQLNEKYGRDRNIYISPPIGYFEALEKTYRSDYVLCIYDPKIGNNKLASPNKVFEAFMLGKPLLINNELDITKFIEEKDIGFTFEFNNNADVRDILRKVIDNVNYNEMSSKARECYNENYSFDSLKRKLTSIYKNILIDE